MFTDIVIPDGNEEEFLAMAKRVGSALVFLYAIPPKESGVPVAGFMKGQVPKGKFDVLISGVESVDHPRANIILIDHREGTDKTHQRTSGLNQVICNAARDKGKILAFDFSQILLAKDRSVILGRMRQNAMLMRKYRNEFLIASFARSPFEMRSGRDYQGFLEGLGFDAPQAKRAVLTLSLFLQKNI